MTFVDSEIIHRFEEEQTLKALEFEPAIVDILEINLFVGLPPSVLRLSLEPAELEKWFEEKSRPVQVRNSAKSLGALRLILGRSADRTKLENPWSEFPIDNSTRAPPLPFSRIHYKLLCDRLCLPRATSGMLARNGAMSSTPHFQIYDLATEEATKSSEQSKDTVGKIGITIKWRGSTLLGMKVSAAMSHCRTTNVTNAVLFCKSSAQAAYIGHTVASIAQVATHPAIIPTLLCKFHLEVLKYKVNTTWDSLLDVETASGQTGILLVNDAGLIPAGNCDDPELSKKAIGVVQLAIAWESYIQSDIELIASINKFFTSYDTVSAESGMQPIQFKQTQVIKEHLSLITQKRNFLQHGVRHLKERAQVQVSMIYNHLAHKSNQINLSLAESSRYIAMDARKDSSVMKSIALLTMTFLPATFIASLFTTPGVASSEPSQELYWAITLPITFFVIFIWICWTLLSMRRINRSAPRGARVVGHLGFGS